MKLKIKELVKVPIKKWKLLFKECYDVIMCGNDDECLESGDFTIGADAENGFLEIDCFCEGLNQSQAIIGETEYRKYILGEGSYTRKKVSILLETEININENDSNTEILKIAFPKIAFDKNLKNKIVDIKII